MKGMSVAQPMTLEELHQWHLVQSRRRDNTNEVELFHLKAAPLLAAISTAVYTLSKTIDGKE